MKQKLLILILFITLFLPIGLCDKIENNINNIDNIKIYDDKEKLISIYDKNNDKSMDIKLIYTSFDINKMIEIVEITNYIEYIPNKKQDFITKTKKIYGNDIYKSEYYIEKYNYNNISIRKEIYNNKTKQNETIIINKIVIDNSYWIKYKPYNKKILKNETFKLKIIHYKKPELGFFKIQTIPIFKNIECKEFTWWNGNWNLKRPIFINNTYGDNVTNYQLKSVNLSIYQINASSARIINETSGLIENHWSESIDDNGNFEFIWCNFSKINNNWINSTYYIYYQSLSNVNSVSNGDNTFIFYDGCNGINGNYPINWIGSSGYYKYSNEQVHTNLTSIKMETTSAVRYDACRNIGLGDINYTLGYYAYIPDTTFKHRMILRDDSIDNRIGIFNFNNIPGKLQIGYGNQLDFAILQWENVEIKINFGNDTISLYLNNIPVDENINHISSISFLNRIWMVGDISGIGYGYIDDIYVRVFTINEPELWTVGGIEYPEVLDMNCSLKIITHLTEKQIKTTYTNGSIINESLSNIQINLPYDSYIIYMSNPVKITSITSLFNVMDNILIQFFLFVLIIIISIVFVLFLNIIKNKGFKGVTK